MKNMKHINYEYIKSRLANSFYEKKNKKNPWLTSDSIKILDSWLKPSDTGLEFGSGRSTHWFASRVSHLTSIEHNLIWYKKISQEIEPIRSKVDYQLHEDGVNNNASSSYVNILRSIQSQSINFCLIDGVSRDYCAVECVDKISPGGIIIIDNANWFLPKKEKTKSPNSRSLKDGYKSNIWNEFGRKVENWRVIWTSNSVTDTAIFISP